LQFCFEKDQNIYFFPPVEDPTSPPPWEPERLVHRESQATFVSVPNVDY
jgi:hypothetical protein